MGSNVGFEVSTLRARLGHRLALDNLQHQSAFYVALSTRQTTWHQKFTWIRASRLAVHCGAISKNYAWPAPWSEAK